MFDGLKDKLSSFRKDVEESAEDEATAEAEAPTDTEIEEAADAATGDDDLADAEATGSETVGAGSNETVETASNDVEAADTEDAGAGVTEDDDAGSNEPSTFQRAKAFATGRIIIEEEDLEQPLWDLEMALLGSDVEMSVAEQILETVRENMLGESRKQVETTGELVESALYDALLEVIAVGQFDFEERIAEADKPVTLVFTGVNGVGKTTSIAKLSEWLADRGYSSVLANGDTYRAGANEQIREHAERLDRELIAHDQGGDPAAVIYDAIEYAAANDVDVVLGDTAGRLHTSDDLMSQLEKIARVVDPDMTIFVDEAVAGQDAVNRAKEFNSAAKIDGAILTKADADSSGGAAISIAYVTGKPILFLGTGQGYDDLTRFDPEALVESLLGD
ncbi:signal recognition particle-docking protein FtsY [Halorubrum vacuolatum]|uniref:Signal recognition particle receptor FtsY n=1 Tax=Halorubrum vacuolatum TaxID=63740 RepID=A0A238URX7_HALVU|nr:signal recognition particle-docking protein FtsY [Halorubrum vacuolatum]SNR24193.1 signal recognition particle-docking protein FtsY [Halorubrum vacuolatum]